MNTRRDALRILGAAAYAIKPVAAAQQQPEHNHTSPADEPVTPPPYTPFLQPAEFATLESVSECIIPRSETPGAKDAGVALLIDKMLTEDPPLARSFRAGLADLNTLSRAAFDKDFTALSAAQQVEILTPPSLNPASPLGKFFTTLKGKTIDAYYSTEIGLKTELGWHGNTYLPDFPGCDHPGHHQN